MAHQVFISYSHIDSQIANGLCYKLEDHGIDCWIAPRNIEAGAVWAKAIAAAIPKCRIMLLVLSGNSNASDQVLREVELAVQNKLVIVPVRIEDIIPTGGMSYYLATMQWIDIRGKNIDNKMALIAGRIENILGIVKGTTAQEHVPAKKEQKPEKAKPKKAEKQKISRQRRKKSIGKRIIAVALSVAATAAAAVFLVLNWADVISIFKPAENKNEDLYGLSVKGNLDWTQTITAEMLGMDPDDEVMVDDDYLSLSIAETLEYDGRERSTDFSVSDMLGLTSLKIAALTADPESELTEYIDSKNIANWTELLDGIVPLEEIKAQYVPDGSTAAINSLKGLEYALNLETLVIYNSDIDDLAPLQNLKKLKILYLINCRIQDLSTISGLSNLEVLCLDGNEISDISKLERLDKVRSLSLGRNSIGSLASCSYMDSLISLSLNDNNIYIIDSIKLMPDLIYLNLNNNYIKSIYSLSALKDLTYLYLDNNSITDMHAFVDCKSLEYLTFRNNNISYIAPLQSAKSLVSVAIAGNPVENFEAIADLPSSVSVLVIDEKMERENAGFIEELNGRFNILVEEETQYGNKAENTGDYAPEDFGLDPSAPVEFESEELINAILYTLEHMGEPVDENLTVEDIFKLKALMITTPNQSISEGGIPMDKSTAADSNIVYKTSEMINSLEGIQYAHNLEVLIIVGKNVEDLYPLSELEKLDTLSFGGGQTQIDNLDALEGLKALRIIMIGDTKVDDFSPLSGLENGSVSNFV